MRHITSQEMREIDRRAQEEFGISSLILMENAGREASRVALDMISGERDAMVICVCGKGNNGGDGFVCSRYLVNHGIDADIFLLGSPGLLKKDAKINYEILKKLGRPIKILDDREDLGIFKKSMEKAQLVIDAIFGIGLSGTVGEPYRSIIGLINQSGKPILALDTPSGLDATDGRMLGICTRATKTVTFALPKTGFIKNDGPSYVGELIIADISIPKVLLR